MLASINKKRWLVLSLAFSSIYTSGLQAESKSNIYNWIGDYANGCPHDSDLNPLPYDEKIKDTPPFSYTKQSLTNGQTALIMSGGVNAGDSTNLDRILSSDSSISEIWLHSPGGNAAEGAAIGRVIRRHKVATRVPARYQCISACTMAFLGGVVRTIEPGSAYGVHTFYNDGWFDVLRSNYGLGILDDFTNPRVKSAYLNPKDPLHSKYVGIVEDYRERTIRDIIHQKIEQRDALLAADQAVYMSEMGVSRLFLRDVVFAQKSQFYTSDTMQGADITGEFLSYAKSIKAAGASDADAINGAIKRIVEAHGFEWASQFRTYMCPTPAQLMKYNVVNVINK
jgi:hypothetical protein